VGAPNAWATIRQVHGAEIVVVDRAGDHGPGDALVTTAAGLGLAIFTADCAGVVIEAAGGVGVAHAGWRGARAGVVAALLERMAELGLVATRAHLGPMIGPCCFEVGAEVAAEFPGFLSTTTWGTTSVDLPSALRAQLGGLSTDAASECTFHDPGLLSHRRTHAPDRMAAVGWLST
jgi:YfiH family protein